MPDLNIDPVPSAEEAAAIVAAIDALWPTAAMIEERDTDRSRNWRFSGRWWRTGRFSDPSRPWS